MRLSSAHVEWCMKSGVWIFNVLYMIFIYAGHMLYDGGNKTILIAKSTLYQQRDPLAKDLFGRRDCGHVSKYPVN